MSQRSKTSRSAHATAREIDAQAAAWLLELEGSELTAERWALFLAWYGTDARHKQTFLAFERAWHRLFGRCRPPHQQRCPESPRTDVGQVAAPTPVRRKLEDTVYPRMLEDTSRRIHIATVHADNGRRRPASRPCPLPPRNLFKRVRNADGTSYLAQRSQAPGLMAGPTRLAGALPALSSSDDMGPAASLVDGSGWKIPLVRFPKEILHWMTECVPKEWRQLDEPARAQVLDIGCKLEPIVQIATQISRPRIFGFECLAQGSAIASTPTARARYRDIDSGVLRLCASVASIHAIATLRNELAKRVGASVRDLVFSVNLDPLMVSSEFLSKFLTEHAQELNRNVLFEVNEPTTLQQVRTLKYLEAMFGLRYSASDVSAWNADTRAAMLQGVAMTKMSCRPFIDTMDLPRRRVSAITRQLRANKLQEKPLIVRGIPHVALLQSLKRHWDFSRLGSLYGQGMGLGSALSCAGDSWGAEDRPITWGALFAGLSTTGSGTPR